MKVFSIIENENRSSAHAFFFVLPKNELMKLSIDEILFFQSIDNKRIIQTIKNRLIVTASFTEILLTFEKHDFYRCHKNYIIQLRTIETFNLNNNEIFCEGFSIPVQKKYKQNLLQLLKVL